MSHPVRGDLEPEATPPWEEVPSLLISGEIAAEIPRPVLNCNLLLLPGAGKKMTTEF
jgi:hypothetical protein